MSVNLVMKVCQKMSIFKSKLDSQAGLASNCIKSLIFHDFSLSQSTIQLHITKQRRGTEPYEIHPTNPDLARLFDMDEHARLKTIPERFLTGVASKTLGHAILGQSVIYNVFCSIGKMLGESLDAIRRLVCRNSLVA